MNLLREGMGGDKVLCSGSLMRELLISYKEKIKRSQVCKNYELEKNEYIVVSLHREENVDSDYNTYKIGKILQKLRSTYKKKIIFSLHPRARKKFELLEEKLKQGIEFVKPLKF